MEQRDLLKDQIEQLGKVLAKIMSDFLGLKSVGNVPQGIEISNERLQSELDISIVKLMSLNKNELKDYFNSRKLTEAHLEVLSEYLKEIGIEKTQTNKAEAALYLERAIELLDIADEMTKTMTLNRINTKNNIKNLLQYGL